MRASPWARPRRSTRGILAVVAATVVVMATGPGTASAHDSEYCGHGQVYGNHWFLGYTGYENYAEYGYNNERTNYHYHWAEHWYRHNDNQTYHYKHDYYLLCRVYAGEPARTGVEHGSGIGTPQRPDPVPVVDDPPLDPDGPATDWPKDIVCTAVSCPPDRRTSVTAAEVAATEPPARLARLSLDSRRPAVVVSTLRKAGYATETRLVTHDALLTQTVSRRIRTAPPRGCVIGLVTRDGMRVDRQHQTRRLTVEVASRSAAASLGHAC